MLFFSFFKTLTGKDVVVELKNGLSICGTLHSVDQYMNIRLHDVSAIDADRYPHLQILKTCFIRGSVVRFVQLPADDVECDVLQDACRKEIGNVSDTVSKTSEAIIHRRKPQSASLSNQ
ncbi:hypothetical protein ACOME3_004117 [Neoechinorhynchus agilis]